MGGRKAKNDLRSRILDREVEINRSLRVNLGLSVVWRNERSVTFRSFGANLDGEGDDTRLGLCGEADGVGEEVDEDLGETRYGGEREDGELERYGREGRRKQTDQGLRRLELEDLVGRGRSR